MSTDLITTVKRTRAMKPAIPSLLRLTCLIAALSLPGAVFAHGFDDDGDDSPGYHGMMMNGGIGMMGGAGMMGGPSGYRGFGMMNGTVAGPGMMGPSVGNNYPPMMGFGPGSADLSVKQQRKLLDLQQAFQAHQLERMQSIQQQSFEMQKAYLGDTPDKQAILDAQKKINEINLKMLEDRLDTREKMQAILNESQ